ncbi:MAG: preprotein translocase subunit SecY [Bacilli bacterium]|nr:preprotein translocase subunit SecY [Erysipelotrichaceae bacterium]MDD6249563.1 preprotein translocase subunit SecY [Bacillales bacterium]MDY2746770.1 preprotein translocase subunit SecY [Bacilli bacterium]MDD7382181.1 preprotein translocase subunit SecY [Bacillales bacterium]MDY3890155.1 preprotein translocase subunit SecY [Bacilli bacterium]
MKKLVAMLKNKDIRDRILFTLMMMFVFRLGTSITVPGVTISKDAMDTTSVLSMMNLLGGGALQNFSVFALGVSPYITSSIIIELLSKDVLPALTELSKEGQSGRKKIEMATRYLTLVLGAVQAYGVIVTMHNSEYISFSETLNFWVYAKLVLYLMAGSMLVMWMADQITEKGIGNGVSMIIFAGIVASLPSQIYTAIYYFFTSELVTEESRIIQGAVKLALYLVTMVAIVIFVTYVEKSIRKIPVLHSGTGGALNAKVNNTSFLPIKINSAGVIPVIFASSIMMAPAVIVSFVVENYSNNDTITNILNIFTPSALTKMPWFDGSTWYMPWGLIIYVILIFVFSFFYSNLTISPETLAEDFQKNGSYIPGIRQGNSTARYVKKVLNRVTFLGACALTFIAVIPVALTLLNVVPSTLSLGGTGLIIVVGVALETVQQLDGLLASNQHANVV